MESKRDSPVKKVSEAVNRQMSLKYGEVEDTEGES